MKKILILYLVFILHQAAFACDCNPISVHEQVQTSELIMQGSVLSIDTISLSDSHRITYKSPDTVYVRDHRVFLKKIKIEKVYKGNVNDTIVYITTGMGGGDCGYQFDIKHKYLIYSSNADYIGMTRKFMSG